MLREPDDAPSAPPTTVAGPATEPVAAPIAAPIEPEVSLDGDGGADRFDRERFEGARALLRNELAAAALSPRDAALPRFACATFEAWAP